MSDTAGQGKLVGVNTTANEYYDMLVRLAKVDLQLSLNAAATGRAAHARSA